MHDPGDLLDVLVEQAERVRVRQHQTRHVAVGLRAQVVQIDAAVGVGRDLDDLQARHRHRRGVRAVGGVRREHLVAVLAFGLVVGAGQQHARELPVRAGGGLQRDVRQAGDLRERRLQVPHQLQRALRARGVLQRVQPRVARGARRRARAGAGCASSCTSRAGRSPSRGRSCASTGRRSGARSPALRPPAAAAGRLRRKRSGSSSASTLGHVELRARERAAPGSALLEDRSRALALERQLGNRGSCASPSAARRRPRRRGLRPGGRCRRASAAR